MRHLSPPQWLKWTLGVSLMLALILWVQQRIGWAALLQPWQQFPPGLLILLTALTAASYLSRSARLQALYQHHDQPQTPFHTYLKINTLHTTLLNLLPMRLGEAAFPLLMKRHLGHHYLDSLSRLLWLRLLDLWTLLSLGLIAYQLLNPQPNHPLALGLIVLALGLPILIQAQRQTLLRRLSPATPPQPNPKQTPRRALLKRSLHRLVQGLPPSRRQYLTVLAWTQITWLLKLTAFLAVLQQFIALPSTQLIPGVIAAEISNALPIQGLAGFGNYELALILGANSPAQHSDQLLAAGVNLHLYILACTLLFGLLALLIPDRQQNPQP